MWISQKINNDPEVKKTLQEITKLIKDYCDPTRIGDHKKFWAMDIGHLFKPKITGYLLVIFLVTIIEAVLFLTKSTQLSILDTQVSLSLRVSIPILVLGISFSTVAKSLSEASRFASEYLKDSCRTAIFACITFLTVLWGYLSSILFPIVETSIASKVIYILLSSFSLGGAIWCLTSLIYIILEITKCMYPEFSIKAASNYASRKLHYAFLKDVYLSVFVGEYRHKLDEETNRFKNIYPPSKYFSREILQNGKDKNNKSSIYKINIPKEINLHLGYRDYNLWNLKKINKLLEQKNAKMYLTPHGFNPKELGVLYCEETCEDLYETISKKLSSIYRFRQDKYIEEEESFWVEHYIKLRSALLRAIEVADMAQFKKYVKSIEETYLVLRKARKYDLVRKNFSLDYKKIRYLFVYSKSVRWLLESTNIEDDILESFLDELVKSIWNHVEDEIRNGDWCTLDIFKWLLPETYQLFELIKDKKPRIWELRARIGSFYDFAGSLLSEYESDIKEDDKLQIQLVLHKGIIRWLLIAIDNKDDELIKSLCEAARRLVFPDKKIEFIPQKLVTQHFILCGKMLEFLMDKKPHVSPDIFKLLCFDKYDHTSGRDIKYDQLVKFFIESRKERGLSDYLREFSSTDWERNPLSGGGFGTPRYTFSENIELDYMFIYLALLTLHLSPDVKPIPFKFSSYNLKDKIDKLKEIARGIIDIYDYPDSKEKLNNWLDRCDQLYKQEEEARIAAAPLDEQIVSQYKDAFWEGYKSVKTFVGFCISQGHCSINNEVSVKSRYIHPKDIFIKGRPSRQGNPHADGEDIASSYDRRLLKEIINSDVKTETETADNITSMFNQACRWLTKKGTNRETGILLFYGNADIQSESYNNDYYIPSWKEETNLVFSGYYKNYPMIEIYDPKIDPKCVAFNLQGWKGLEIRPEVLEKDILGEINIREWTEEEINEAIRKKQIAEEHRNHVKGQCPVEYELFWRLDEKVLPMQMVVSLKAEAGTD